MRHEKVSRGILGVTFLVVLTLGVGGCGGSSGGSSSGDKVVGVSLAGKQIPYYNDLAAGMQAEADRLGNMSVKIQYANQDVTTQIDQVQNLLTQQPDGLVVGPIDQEAMVPAYRQASDANTPIVTVSDNIGPDGRKYQLAFMGQEYTQAGRRRATWLVNQLHGKGTVGVVHAIRGGNYTESNWIGAKSVFAKYPGITVYDGPYVGDFTPQAGLQGAQTVLTQHPDVDALYMDNDDLAYGAIQAVADAGRSQKSILILGNDGGQPAIVAVKNGDLDYTLSVCGYAQGVAAIRTLNDYLVNGTKPPAYVNTLQLAFTPQNVNKVLASRKGKPKCTPTY